MNTSFENGFPLPGVLLRAAPPSGSSGQVPRFGVMGGPMVPSGLLVDGVRDSRYGANVFLAPDDDRSPNISLVLCPKGTGSLILGPRPDGKLGGVQNGTAGGGGNARGSNCLDLQWFRYDASRVVSGQYGFATGVENTVTGYAAGAIGEGNGAGGRWTFTAGAYCGTSGDFSIALGGWGVSTGLASIGMGHYFSATLRGQLALAGGRFGASGDAQWGVVQLRRQTADATASDLFLDGASERLLIASNKTYLAEVSIVARTSTAAGTIESAAFRRTVLISRGAAAATTTVVAQETVGSDLKSAGAAAWTVTLSADTANGALNVSVSGAARWLASTQLTEITYA